MPVVAVLAMFGTVVCVFVPQKHPEALYNLGLLHAYGRGVSQDYTRAAMLFEKVIIYLRRALLSNQCVAACLCVAQLGTW